MEGIGNWIPQFFYDLIGRIVPGFFLILITAFIIFDYATVQTFLKEVNLYYSLILLAVSYVIGSLIGGLKLFLSSEYNKDTSEENFLNELNEKLNSDELSVSFIYDLIKYDSPSDGMRLAKLSAERYFADVLIIGSAIIIVAYSFIYFLAYNLDTLKYLVFMLILTFIIFSSLSYKMYITIRSNKLMQNIYKLIERDRKKIRIVKRNYKKLRSTI